MRTERPSRLHVLSAFALVLPLLGQLSGCAASTSPDDLAAQVRSDVERRRGGVYSQETLYLEAGGNAEHQADLWRDSDPEGAAVMDVIATRPIAIWLGDWLADVTDTVDDALDAAAGELPVFVVYNIPNRDCGAWSAGGVDDSAAYADFVDGIAAGLEGRLAILVVEPDGLAAIECLDSAAEADRKQMMSDAVDTLTAAGGTVYLDAGDSNWIPADDMAQQLLDAGVQNAAGFALNVSHTEFVFDEVAYAEEIRAIVGLDAHYLVDTSRSGAGPADDNEWCNPPGRAAGQRPTLEVGHGGLDGLLWIKRPGESDGSCNGGPVAGAWWPEYARDLQLTRQAL